ncbi:MAG: hypothetical protein AABN33_10355 [Acidobacteriota bacterium]
MILSLLLSFIISFAIGFLVISLIWPFTKSWPSDLLVKLSLAVGIGQGLTSCGFFLWLIVFGSYDTRIIIAEVILLAGLLAALVYRATKRDRSSEAERDSDTAFQATSVKLRHGWLLAVAFYTMFVSTAFSIVIALLRSPHGIWDAWAIHNLRARWIFRGAIYWRDSFLIPWTRETHADYPLLLPMSVARGWLYTGGETTAVPAMLSLFFTLGNVGLVCSALAVLRGKLQGYLAGIVLMGYTFFIEHGGWEYADPPLMFFFTATVTLIAFQFESAKNSYNMLVLAGLAAGLSAWTKNEGLLFILSIAAAYTAVVLPAEGLRAYLKKLLFFSIGLLPALTMVLYFKIQLAPSNDLTSAMMSQVTLNKLLDYHRYASILRAYMAQILFYSGHAINLFFLLAIYLVCCGATLRHKRSVICTAILLCLMLTGYTFVYLTTPHDLTWHLQYSTNRLLLQLWPSFVFLFFLTALTPEEMLRKEEVRRPYNERPAHI